MTTRKKLLLGAGVVLVVLVAAGAVFALTRPPQDVSNPDVAFEDEPTVTPVPDGDPRGAQEGLQEGRTRCGTSSGAGYGYSKDRRKFMPASKLLRPPYWRVWSYTGLGPARVLARRWPRASSSCSRTTARCTRSTSARARRSGSASSASWPPPRPRTATGASSPRSSRAARASRARVYALDAKTGKILWKRLLPSRTRVLAGVRQRPRLPRLRERHGLLDPRRRRRGALEVQGLGRGQERAGAGRRQALLRRLLGQRLRDPPGRRRRGLEHRDQGRRARA